MAFLEWQGIAKGFAGAPAVDGFTLSVSEGEILALLGPSGSGKSTLLRITAGLEREDAGAVIMQGRNMAPVPAHKRGIGLMFQDYCLFPHLSVAANIAFGLRGRGLSADGTALRVAQLLSLVHLSGFEKRNVLSLSGGEQQRIALARSLAPSPRLLLLDEPLGALDAALRGDLLTEMARVLREVGITVIYVTHDHDEAVTVASRVALMDAGRLVQTGTPAELLRAPASAFVARFFGLGAIVEATTIAEGGGIRTPLGDFPLQAGRAGPIVLLVAPEAVGFAARPGGVAPRARVLSTTVRAVGTSVRVELRGSGEGAYQILVEVPEADPSAAQWRGGAERTVWIDPARCRVLPA